MSLVAHRTPTSRYRPPPHRSLPPLPPRWVEQHRAVPRPPPLTQFVILSMLLHALAIALFGAPPGGSREGRAVWGALRQMQVVLAPAAPPGPAIMPRLLDRIAAPEPVSPPPLLVPPPTGFEVAPLPRVAVPQALPRAERRVLDSPLAPAPVLQPAPIDAPAPPPAVAPPPVVATPAPLPRVERPAAEAPPLVSAPSVEAPAPPPRVEPMARPEPPAAVDRALTQEIERPAERAPTALERALARPPAIQAAPLPGPGVAMPAAPAVRPREPSPDYDPTAAPPALDADALRRRAGEIAKGTGNRALLPFAMPPVDPPRSRMETVIENARKPDCREHYRSLGLAAIVPLIANEFGEGKCKW